MLIIDTSVAISLREADPEAVSRLQSLAGLPLLSVVSVVELEGGAASAPEGAAARRIALDELYSDLEILPFEQAEAAAYRSIIESLGFSRRLIIDRMIAAQAIVACASLATFNPRDFRDIPGLTIDDWSA